MQEDGISESPWRFWPREEVEDRRVLLPVMSPDVADTLSTSISMVGMPKVLVTSSGVDTVAAGGAAEGVVGVSGLLKRLGGGACIAG